MELQYFLRERFSYCLVLGISAAVALTGCGSKDSQSAPAEEVNKVSVRMISGAAGSEQLDYSGSLEADNTVDLAFSVGGRIVAVKVEEGQHVTRGTLLAEVEAVKYQSAFEIADASYTKAKDQFGRSKELYDRGSLPERDFIAAKADLAQAKANRDIAAKDLADTRLLAPFTGVVTRKITELGSLTAPGTPVFTLTKTDVMYATASIAEGDIGHVSTGDSVLVNIPALGEQRIGSVNILNPQAESYSRTFEVKVRLRNEDGKILPGMMAQMHIYTGVSESRITIPTSCILKDTDNIAYVFLAQADHTAIKRRIAITRAVGLDEVIVSSGLQAGDQLIVAGFSRLQDGSHIQF